MEYKGNISPMPLSRIILDKVQSGARVGALKESRLQFLGIQLFPSPNAPVPEVSYVLFDNIV